MLISSLSALCNIAPNPLCSRDKSDNTVIKYLNHLCCLGQIILPPGGKRLIFSNQSMAKIEWSIEPTLSTSSIVYRSWTFTSSNGEKAESLAQITANDQVMINTKLYDVDIEKPATLVLKNVNGSYNGTYTFTLLSPNPSTSDVVVFIAGKFKSRGYLVEIISVTDNTTVKCYPCLNKAYNIIIII